MTASLDGPESQTQASRPKGVIFLIFRWSKENTTDSGAGSRQLPV